MRLRVPDVDDPDFVAEVTFGHEGGRLALAGSADASASARFRELIDGVHAQLCGRRARAVVIDMQALDRMAAGCFRELVAWVGRLQQLAPAERYQIRVRPNPAIAWQDGAVRALACFDTSIVVVVVET